jgi:hypothetical protein
MPKFLEPLKLAIKVARHVMRGEGVMVFCKVTAEKDGKLTVRHRNGSGGFTMLHGNIFLCEGEPDIGVEEVITVKQGGELTELAIESLGKYHCDLINDHRAINKEAALSYTKNSIKRIAQ